LHIGSRGSHEMTLSSDGSKIYMYGGEPAHNGTLGAISFDDLWILSPLPSVTSSLLAPTWQRVILSAGSLSPG
jgi:hypothetical protein